MSDFDHVSTPSPSPVIAVSTDERQWGMFAHLSALTGLFSGGVGNIVGPLVIWLVRKDTPGFASEQAKEALNFNITLALVAVVLLVATFVTFGLGIVLTAPLGLLLALAWLVLTIVAGLRANDGIVYRYPLTLRLVR